MKNANTNRMKGRGKRSSGNQNHKDSKIKRVNYDNTREDKFERDEEGRGWVKSSKANDVSWYAKSPELLRSAASLPFSTTTGVPLPFGNGEAVPGVMGIYWHPFIGKDNFALKAAQDSVYSFTVHANSRNKSYDAPDQMLLILAGAQVFSFLAHGIRAYGVMRKFDQRNRYLPKALVRAMGFDYEDLEGNLAKMWFDLNQAISRISQIWIPNTMPFVERQFWLNSNVYMDGDSVKSQYYVFTPQLVYRYNETLTEQGGGLESAGWDGLSANTWLQYMNCLGSMINALVDSQDRGIIFGDILKAYGEDKLYSVAPISSDYSVDPVYDREVLTQIENSNCWTVQIPNVYQDIDTQYLYQPAPEVNAANIAHSVICNSVLNFHFKDTPTPEQIMVATRLKCVGNNLTLDGNNAITHNIPWQAGTEYVYIYRFFYFNDEDTEVHFSNFAQKIEHTEAYIDTIRRWSAFDWAPWMYIIDPVNKDTAFNLTPKDAFGDFDNYTVVGFNELDKMHRTAVYSEFGVPAI